MPKTTLRLSLVCAALLVSSAAFGFNPQPDPPGKKGAVAAFNPQPDPPGRQKPTACPQLASRDAASGLPSGKRTVDGNTERKSGGQLGADISAAGAGSSGGEACGFEQPK